VEIPGVMKKIGEYWDQRSSGFDEEHDTEDINTWMRSLKALLGADINKSVLDLGTGTGFLANMTAKLGYSTIGVDISGEMLKYAVNHAETQETNAVFMKGNILALPFVDNIIDYIINSRLLWTLVEPDAVIKEWRRILKPGGKILCFHRMKEGFGLTTNKNNVYQDDAVAAQLQISGARMEELTALLKRNGLLEVKIEKLPGLTRPGFDYEPWFVLMGTKIATPGQCNE
jgi:ubiquinone/menaquinone biosynthesis C-methylase UbiE